MKYKNKPEKCMIFKIFLQLHLITNLGTNGLFVVNIIIKKKTESRRVRLKLLPEMTLNKLGTSTLSFLLLNKIEDFIINYRKIDC